jgi:GAF domain-containing protein
MRGWLAVPLIGRDGRNYGLLQASDKESDAEFTPEDEARLKLLAKLTGAALDALCRLYHNVAIGHEPGQGSTAP